MTVLVYENKSSLPGDVVLSEDEQRFFATEAKRLSLQKKLADLGPQVILLPAPPKNKRLTMASLRDAAGRGAWYGHTPLNDEKVTTEAVIAFVLGGVPGSVGLSAAEKQELAQKLGLKASSAADTLWCLKCLSRMPAVQLPARRFRTSSRVPGGAYDVCVTVHPYGRFTVDQVPMGLGLPNLALAGAKFYPLKK